MLRRAILTAILTGLCAVTAVVVYQQATVVTARIFVERLFPYPSGPFAVAAGTGAALWAVGLVWLVWDGVMAVVRLTQHKKEKTHA